MPQLPDPPERDPGVEHIVRALKGHGPLRRDRLAELSQAGSWGPGRTFQQALDAAVEQGAVRRLDGDLYAPAGEGG